MERSGAGVLPQADNQTVDATATKPYKKITKIFSVKGTIAIAEENCQAPMTELKLRAAYSMQNLSFGCDRIEMQDSGNTSCGICKGWFVNENLWQTWWHNGCDLGRRQRPVIISNCSSHDAIILRHHCVWRAADYWRVFFNQSRLWQFFCHCNLSYADLWYSRFYSSWWIIVIKNLVESITIRRAFLLGLDFVTCNNWSGRNVDHLR